MQIDRREPGMTMQAHDIPPGVLPAHNALFYGGRWHEPMAGTYADTINPASNRPLAQAPVAQAHDVDAAVRAAHAAFPAWAKVPPIERGRLLRQAAQVLREHAHE